ncbi:probable xyloglucan endotransglucosylase/hydrolase protein 30 isoform X2 [Phragmites australis]|uniref:probable xyloglucan endotransglucosylase/hydrolase protein 30 isoform X2 n=1 Tax=Phragmites australis TaxID=29695 RepID=UPI002D793E3E|nr:probable xyloglucan endotransglucosylase/hydrolase protein 30 isoform X2 [Phragmites australis]
MEAKARFLLAVATWVCFSAVAASAFDVPSVAFDERFSPLFGNGNLVRSSDDRSVRLLLDRRSGSGFISSDYYLHGFFSTSVKLPKDYTAGVVVAFYLSNGDVYERTHDELDFEFLGSRWGGQWRVQTNVYGNGSTARGREERYLLPFDPTLEAHRYAVLWAPTHIIFYIDDTPIREVIRHPDMGGDFPAKPMAVYATVWDGSAWATDGGKYKVNYKYAPFASEFSDLTILGCRADPVLRVGASAAGECSGTELLGLMTAGYAVMTPQKRAAMRAFRVRQMTYTVCYDAVRYASGPFPECDNSDDERETFSAWGESKTVVMRTRSRGRRRGRPAGAVARARGRSDVASS